jgi:hypothetical protein
LTYEDALASRIQCGFKGRDDFACAVFWPSLLSDWLHTWFWSLKIFQRPPRIAKSWRRERVTRAWLEEHRVYHRDANGRVVAENDDAISASRYA